MDPSLQMTAPGSVAFTEIVRPANSTGITSSRVAVVRTRRIRQVNRVFIRVRSSGELSY